MWPEVPCAIADAWGEDKTLSELTAVLDCEGLGCCTGTEACTEACMHAVSSFARAIASLRREVDGNTASGEDEAGGAGLGPERDTRYCGDPRINCTEKFGVVEEGS